MKNSPAKQTKKSATSNRSEKKTVNAKSRVKSTASTPTTSNTSQPTLERQVKAVLASLKQLSDKRVLEDMPKRYGVYTNKA
ncbi:MAG TPA: hypothetical protein VN687_17795, partial [Blastocatellia bacterium]|nr:hypothetical protein [Blastocatellia bacterium]